MTADHLLARLPGESGRAYAAFLSYIGLSPDERSIDAAWRSTVADQGQDQGKKRSPGHWQAWSSKYDWVSRALAYDERTAAQDADAWAERRRVLRERDWAQADVLRGLVDAGLIAAAQFVHSETKHLAADGDHPAQVIIRERFDLSALLRALLAASKLQHSAIFWPVAADVPLSAATLDLIIERELLALAAGRADDGTLIRVAYADAGADGARES